MSTKEMKAAVERVFEEVWNKKNYAVIDEVYAENLEFGTSPDPHQGREGMVRLARTMLNALPDMQVTILDMIAEHNKVVTHWSAKGTWEHPTEDRPATGKVTEWQGVSIERFVNGKIAEIWIYSNLDEVLGAVELIRQPIRAQQLSILGYESES